MEQKIIQLINQYVNFLKQNPTNKDEVYKWEAIMHFQWHWQPEAENFGAMLENALKKRENLIQHYIPYSFIPNMRKYNDNVLKELLGILYDENIDLKTRFFKYKELSIKYMNEFNKKFKKDDKVQQDDNMLAFLLTMRYPDKYYLYTPAIYNWLTDYLEVAPQKKFYYKYEHYMLLGDKFLPFIQQNSELQSLAKAFIPKDFQFDSSRLLFQDMVYQLLMPEEVKFKNFEKLLKKKFSKEDIDYYLLFLKEIIDKHEIQYGDNRCNYTLTDTGIHFTIGQYYVWNMFKTKQKRFGAISSEPISTDYDKFEITEKEPYYNKFNTIPHFTTEQKSKIHQAIEFQLNRTKKSGYRKHNHETFEKYIFAMKKNNLNAPASQSKFNQKHPLNQILYGPPGTGKTYKSKQIAVEIIDGEAPANRMKLNERYDKLVNDGQIAFVSFHQSMNYEDFIEGIKPALNDNEQVIYKIEDGIFKQICSDAQANRQQNYVLIIDEINRANVSAVFGELISLIEPDKRKGQKEALNTILPYSKEKFSVPDNLYLIGTMNTADRSVEALDTALRRRFSFTELMPDAGIFKKLGEKDEIFTGIRKSDILKTINNRIELLLDRDHTIGHSYFIGVNTPEKLVKVFNDKILPLLQEYFYGDYAKIRMILGKYFVKKIKTEQVNFADFENIYDADYKEYIYRLSPVSNQNIEKAMQNLLNLNNHENNR